MNTSIIQYCIFDPTTKLFLSKINFYGYSKENRSIYNLGFVGDMWNALIMNKPQAEERLNTLKNGLWDYRITGASDISINDLEIKKIEISYLLLE